MMNDMIQTLFQGFAVDGKEIPVKFMYYIGHGEPFIVYMKTDADNSISGDDGLIGYVDYYDFDIYAKGNYSQIVESVIQIMTNAGWTWQPSRSSGDQYEEDTGYYHITLQFAYPKEVNYG